jgi:hypothetical protein
MNDLTVKQLKELVKESSVEALSSNEAKEMIRIRQRAKGYRQCNGFEWRTESYS